MIQEWQKNIKTIDYFWKYFAVQRKICNFAPCLE